jgi:hypothetical protein
MSYEIVPGGESGPDGPDGPEVGEFRQGSRLGDAALRQYLLLRVLAASIQRTIQWFAIALIVVAVAVWFADHRIISVLVGLVGIGWLLVARLVAAIIRRVSGTHRLGPADEARVNDLVKQTRKGLRAELKRVDLPSGPWGEFRVGVRLIRPIARVSTLRRMAGMKLESILPASYLDELHMLLRQRSG